MVVQRGWVTETKININCERILAHTIRDYCSFDTFRVPATEPQRAQNVFRFLFRRCCCLACLHERRRETFGCLHRNGSVNEINTTCTRAWFAEMCADTSAHQMHVTQSEHYHDTFAIPLNKVEYEADDDGDDDVGRSDAIFQKENRKLSKNAHEADLVVVVDKSIIRRQLQSGIIFTQLNNYTICSVFVSIRVSQTQVVELLSSVLCAPSIEHSKLYLHRIQ